MIKHIVTLLEHHPYIDVHLNSPTLQDQLYLEQIPNSLQLIPWCHAPDKIDQPIKIRPFLESQQPASCLITDLPIKLDSNAYLQYSFFIWQESEQKQAFRDLYRQIHALNWSVQTYHI